jgi:Ca2+-binding EF-hand superfamily protein
VDGSRRGRRALWTARRRDEDGSGAISGAELGELFEAMGRRLTPDETASMLRRADKDGSGEVGFDRCHARHRRGWPP